MSIYYLDYMEQSGDQNLSLEEVEKILQDDDEPGTPRAVTASTNTNPPRTSSVGTETESRARSSSASTSATYSCGQLPCAYYNVRAARAEAGTVRPLTGSEVHIKNDLGSFLNNGDERVTLANHRHCFSTKTNLSTSFEIDTMICNTCTGKGKHKVLRRETERPDTVDESPLCFVLSDQCCPPVLPPEDEGDCFKFIRIEDGGVMELVSAFIEMTKGFVIPAGTVLVLFSSSHLSRIGTESYAAEFDMAKMKLSKVMGDGIVLLHGFPVLYNTTHNMALIRSILDLEHWISNVHKGRDIARVRHHVIKLSLGMQINQFSAGGCDGLPGATSDGQSVGSPGAPTFYPMRMMLPSLQKYSEKICFESPVYVSVPQCTEPINDTDEGLIFELLAEVLNESFMTELAKEFNTDRERGADEAGTDSALDGKRFILIGASHASRLANALEELGATILDISVPGWKITESSVEDMKGELSSVLGEEFSGETFIIYQLYDNSM
jgi:hypothetical protein